MPTSAPLRCNDDDNNGGDDDDDDDELSEKCLLYFDFGALKNYFLNKSFHI